jgi:hypothetical protein
MRYSAFKGDRLDLETYSGKSTLDFEIRVLYPDGAPVDLSVYSSVAAKLYYRQGGELILSPTISSVEEVMFLTVTLTQTTALQRREYWLETYGVDGTEQELLTYGILKNI